MQYGADIATLAKHFSETDSADPTVDLVKHLALAWRAASRLREMGVSLDMSNKRDGIVVPTIEKAYREALHVRSRLPSSVIDVSNISRLGRINHGEG